MLAGRRAIVKQRVPGAFSNLVAGLNSVANGSVFG